MPPLKFLSPVESLPHTVGLKQTVNEPALLQPSENAIVDHLLHLDLLGARVAQLHQPLDVAQPVQARKGLPLGILDHILITFLSGRGVRKLKPPSNGVDDDGFILWSQTERDSFEQTLEHGLDGFSLLLQVAPFDDHSLTGKWNLGLLQLRENREPLLSKPATKDSVQDRRVDLARFECLGKDRLIADHENVDVIPPRIKPDMLQPEQPGHPDSSREALHPEALPAKILSALNARRSHQIIVQPVGERSDELKVCPANDRGHGRGGTRVADLNISCGKRRDEDRRLPDEDSIRRQTVLGKKALLLSDPKGGHTGVHSGVGDDDLRRRCGAFSPKALSEEHKGGENDPDEFTHGAPPVTVIAPASIPPGKQPTEVAQRFPPQVPPVPCPRG